MSNAEQKKEVKQMVKTHMGVEKELKERRKQMDSEVKILLLGAGESGKSTIFKQIKILRKNGFNKEEAREAKVQVYNNIAVNFSRLINGALDKKLQFSDSVMNLVDQMQDFTENSVLAIENFDKLFIEKLAPGFQEVSKEEAFKKAFEDRKEFHVDDGFEYFMRKFDDIIKPSYVPTQDDILNLRVRTVGIVEMDFTVKGAQIRVVDVAGQRNERRKWIHMFDDVTCILFVTALSDYDQLCMEDNLTNRMVESIKLFDTIVNNPYFQQTPIVLFMNKTDLLKKKLPVSPLSKLFPDYTGGDDYDLACAFIQQQFVEQMRTIRPIYSHFTCATDTNQITAVLTAVEDIILKGKLEASGLI